VARSNTTNISSAKPTIRVSIAAQIQAEEREIMRRETRPGSAIR
jgi:hypothetical protein